jgi:hypothetical protein
MKKVSVTFNVEDNGEYINGFARGTVEYDIYSRVLHDEYMKRANKVMRLAYQYSRERAAAMWLGEEVLGLRDCELPNFE